MLAGTGTLRIERYGVLVRDQHLLEVRRAEGRASQPLAVAVSRSGDVPFDIPLFSDQRSRIALYVPAGTRVPNCAAEVTTHAIPTAGGELWEVLRSLRRDHDIRSLLCEGGPVLFNAMLAQDLVDELFLTVAPALVGGDGFSITAGVALHRPWPCGWSGHLKMMDTCFCATPVAEPRVQSSSGAGLCVAGRDDGGGRLYGGVWADVGGDGGDAGAWSRAVCRQRRAAARLRLGT